MPLDIFTITERCEELEKLQRVVNCNLSFSVMSNSEHFVDGMTNIKGVEQDLSSIKDTAADSKRAVEFLRAKIALTS